MTDIQELLNQIERADLDAAPLLVHQLLQDLDISELDSHQALRTARALSVHGGPQQLPIAGELAIRAHRADLPGAGVLFAEAFNYPTDAEWFTALLNMLEGTRGRQHWKEK